MDDTPTTRRMSRRSFTTLVAVGTGALAVGGVGAATLLTGTPAGVAVQTFGVEHDDDVYVTMTNGREFVVEVKQRGSGVVLETHEGVTAYNLLSLKSDYVTITEVA
jgi:hypothetical protein